MLTLLWKRHGVVFAAGALCVLVNTQGLGPLWYTGVALLALGGLMRWSLTRRQRPPRERTPVPVEVPVTGRWRALNGPGTKVPSHTHSHAQTYAIDLTHHPRDAAPPPFHWLWPLGHSPHRYPAFGSPVLAPCDGVVVATADGQRDHLSRNSLPGYAYLVLEGFIRSLGRRRHLWGNYIVLKLDQGQNQGQDRYVGLAHLRRRSLRVAVGDRVTAGRQLAECGNSGNSSEPHLHFQLMDGPDSALARGLPFTWRYLNDEGAELTGVPEDNTYVIEVPRTPDTGTRRPTH